MWKLNFVFSDKANANTKATEFNDPVICFIIDLTQYVFLVQAPGFLGGSFLPVAIIINYRMITRQLFNVQSNLWSCGLDRDGYKTE